MGTSGAKGLMLEGRLLLGPSESLLESEGVIFFLKLEKSPLFFEGRAGGLESDPSDVSDALRWVVAERAAVSLEVEL